jgi:signal transduction histidine kinase
LGLLDTLDRLNMVRRGLIVVHPIVFDPAELLRQAKRDLSNRAAAKDQQIHIDGDAKLPPVLADGDLAQEVLNTLLDNAIRYTDYGGEIRVTAESVGTDILFTITDTGIGLEPTDLDKIGLPFFRASQQPMVQSQPGAGLRLFIARQLLNVQGGELFYSGEPGLGASFSFTLPVVPS